MRWRTRIRRSISRFHKKISPNESAFIVPKSFLLSSYFLLLTSYFLLLTSYFLLLASSSLAFAKMLFFIIPNLGDVRRRPPPMLTAIHSNFFRRDNLTSGQPSQ